MAYAVVAGLPPVTGLWATIGPLAVYAVLGSSRQLSVGPGSTTALMTAVLLIPLAAGEARPGARRWPRRWPFWWAVCVSSGAWPAWVPG